MLTRSKAFQNSKLTLGASITLVAHKINMMRKPAARDKVEVSQG